MIDARENLALNANNEMGSGDLVVRPELYLVTGDSETTEVTENNPVAIIDGHTNGLLDGYPTTKSRKTEKSSGVLSETQTLELISQAKSEDEERELKPLGTFSSKLI